MKTGRQEVSILVIDSDEDSLAAIQDALSGEFSQIEMASSLAQAENGLSSQDVDLVICEINAGCVEGDIFDSTGKLARVGEILFLSAGQQAAVAFREFSGRPFFCLRKQACRDLLLLIVKQVLQRSTSQNSPVESVNRANIPLPTLTYPSAVSNIHPLY